MQVVVRKADTDDAKGLLALDEEFNGKGITTEEHIVDALLNNHQEIVLVATIGDQVVGFICGQICRNMCYCVAHGEIGDLYVGEEHRRKGVATKLMHQLEQVFLNGNCLVITLATSVRNTTAQKFYSHLGYIGKEKLVYRKNI